MDTSPPKVIDCPSDIYKTVETGTSYITVWWSTPLATDFSETFTTRSHEPGDSFRVGVTSVMYHFEDEFSNRAQCNFTVYVDTGKHYYIGEMLSWLFN